MGTVADILLDILEQIKGLRSDVSLRNPPQWQVPTISAPQPMYLTRCHVCGLDLTGTMGYVCQSTRCPTGLGPTSSLATTGG